MRTRLAPLLITAAAVLSLAVVPTNPATTTSSRTPAGDEAGQRVASPHDGEFEIGWQPTRPRLAFSPLERLPPAAFGPAMINGAELVVAIQSLGNHVNGSALISQAALDQVRIDIVAGNEAQLLRSSSSTMQLAYGVVQDYEARHGALFTSDGTQEFATEDSSTDGRAQERAMHQLYLAVFDAIDGDMIRNHPELIDGLAFEARNYFPGATPFPSNPNALYSAQVQASMPQDWGRPTLYSELPALQPTGAYLAAGSIGEVIVPASLVNSGFRVRVGAHAWDLSQRPTQKRLARASKVYDITSTTTKIANPLGGNVYIEVPHLANAGMVTVQLRNTIRAPYFSTRSWDMTSSAEWDAERQHPGTFVDLISDRSMLSIPSSWVRNGYPAADVLAEWDESADAQSDYTAKPQVRNKPIVYAQVDVMFRGVAYFPGYPMSNYPSFNSPTAQGDFAPGATINSTTMHEMGHATIMTTFRGGSEAEVHLPYVLRRTRQGMNIQEAFSLSLTHSNSNRATTADALASWALTDDFIQGQEADWPNKNYYLRGYGGYVDLVDIFGWELMTSFYNDLHEDFEANGYSNVPKWHNTHADDDRILRLSRAAGVDLRPLIHVWGHGPDDPAALQASLDSEGLVPSARVFDKMVSYRAAIPMNQAQFNAFWSRIGWGGLTNEPMWAPLQTEFDVSRAQSATSRIDQLIALYFPNGRPNSPVRASVFQSVNSTGPSWELSEGVFNIAAVAASAVGDNAASSIEIADGYQVKLCEHPDGAGRCRTFLHSIPSLESLNDVASYFVVSPTSQVAGDATCNGSIDNVDALAILQYRAGLRTGVDQCPLQDPETQMYMPGADVHTDATVNLRDALAIARCTEGLPTPWCP